MKTKNKKMEKAILYTRVSRGEVIDPKDSLDSQEEQLNEYCLENEIEVIQVYKDVASGENFNRPQFLKMYLNIRSGREKANLLLFTSFDKFCSNLIEHKKMYEHLIELEITPKGIEQVNVCFIQIIKKD
ncbi:MAG: recombinase family protein [Bacteroidetes bacterium]|nr:recombinase family protein [Bacteroidota bacterium]